MNAERCSDCWLGLLYDHREEFASKYVPGATWVFDTDSERGTTAIFTRPGSESEGVNVFTITTKAPSESTVDEFFDDYEADVLQTKPEPSRAVTESHSVIGATASRAEPPTSQSPTVANNTVFPSANSTQR